MRYQDYVNSFFFSKNCFQVKCRYQNRTTVGMKLIRTIVNVGSRERAACNERHKCKSPSCHNRYMRVIRPGCLYLERKPQKNAAEIARARARIIIARNPISSYSIHFCKRKKISSML